MAALLKESALKFYKISQGSPDLQSQSAREARQELMDMLVSIDPVQLGVAPAILASTVQLPLDMDDVTYIDVYEHPQTTSGIFVMKKGSRLPLHDHPGMFVFRYTITYRRTTNPCSQLLFGSVECKVYHLEEPVGLKPQGTLLTARLVKEAKFDPSSGACVVEPLTNNLHDIRALTDCAFIDIIGPPYDAETRPCTYFKDMGKPNVGDFTQLMIVDEDDADDSDHGDDDET
jgi:cysteamine dioxygenase